MTAANKIKFNAQGLVPVIAQDEKSNKVLMMAWMNRAAFEKTVATGYMVYYSRSRQSLWHKGEQSGHRQKVIALYIDCDNDVILAQIKQQGGIACHTGRAACFYRQLKNDNWLSVEPVLRDPKQIYKS